ncbi:MAG: DUF4286 family protein [Bacteroidia bacterium]|nr:DUF4286 family protein [Bacteroidia bacterium]
MIVYSVTINIENDVHDEWLRWMKEMHIPAVMKTGCFINSKMLRLLSDEPQGQTYSMQYTANSMTDYETYITTHAPALRKDFNERFPNKFVAFRTLLEEV